MIEAVGRYVLVEVLPEPGVSAGGIVIPDQADHKLRRGKVLSVGHGMCEKGEGGQLLAEVVPGDTVYFQRHTIGYRMKVDEKECIFLIPDELLGRESVVDTGIPDLEEVAARGAD